MVTITELFDSPHQLVDTTPNASGINKAEKYHALHDVKSYMVRNSDTSDEEKYITYHKGDGIYEIHHIHNGVSGEMIGKKSNPKFISTTIQIVKKLMTEDKPIRIVAQKHNKLITHYHNIVKKLVADNPNVNVSGVSFHEHSSKLGELHKFTISSPHHKMDAIPASLTTIQKAVKVMDKMQDKVSNLFHGAK